jgi:nucleoid DNA-binding protein
MSCKQELFEIICRHDGLKEGALHRVVQELLNHIVHSAAAGAMCRLFVSGIFWRYQAERRHELSVRAPRDQGFTYAAPWGPCWCVQQWVALCDQLHHENHIAHSPTPVPVSE